MSSNETRVERKPYEVYVYSVANNRLIGYGGKTKASPLSNFYTTQFRYGGHQFNTSESAIMYVKAITFGDTLTADKILKCKTPMMAKRLGRQVRPFNNDQWRAVCDQKVPEILYAKFTQNPALRQWLLDTGDAVLAEIALQTADGRIRYGDKVWGIQLGAYHKDIHKPDEWHKYGLNFLGKTLMTVRKTIANETNH